MRRVAQFVLAMKVNLKKGREDLHLQLQRLRYSEVRKWRKGGGRSLRRLGDADSILVRYEDRLHVHKLKESGKGRGKEGETEENMLLGVPVSEKRQERG